MLPQNKPDRIRIVFDDHRLVANAGLLLPATLARHLGLRELVDHHLDLGGAPGRANTGDKMLTLVASALAGGDCIDDADALRAGGTVGVLGCVVKAPSTLGTFLRSFRWGHVRQLDRVSRQLLARAWAAGAGPGDSPLTIDLDSTICETYGLAKEGARHHGYTGKRGYHPLLAIADGTGDVLMSRLREGRANTARGAAHFLRETVGRVRYAGANGRLTLRADSGFYTHGVVSVCRKMDVRFSITIRQHKSLHNLIEAIPEDAWTPIPYWMDGAADVAETTCTPFQAEADAAPVRLIVRRVKPTPGSQLALFAKYSYHGFITDRDGELLELEADHRRHAEIENAIRDLKYGVGLNHLPSGRFAANGAWLAVPRRETKQTPVLPYAVCDSADNYSTVWSKVFRQIELVENRPQLGFLSAVDSNVINLASRHAGEFSPDDVVRLLQFLAATSASVVVTVDEFDRLMDPQATTLFADTIKGLSDTSVDVTLLLVGVADSVNELIREHQSAERACAQIRVPRMSPQELQEILVQGFRSVEMMIDGNALASIVSLSQGLPHYTHLLGLTAGREALKLGRLKVTRSDVISAIAAALAGVNESISSAYHNATMSSRTTIYPQVLLACALAELDERGTFAASDVRAPMSSIMGTRYDVPGFAKNLHDLCQEHRGPILHRIGVAKRYRYRFINPLMQPFVIMHGLHNGLITEEGLISQGGLKTEV